MISDKEYLHISQHCSVKPIESCFVLTALISQQLLYTMGESQSGLSYSHEMIQSQKLILTLRRFTSVRDSVANLPAVGFLRTLPEFDQWGRV